MHRVARRAVSHWSARLTNSQEIATELLVADGISVNAEDANGKTALQHAVDRGNTGVATLITTIMDAFDVDD